VRTVNSRRFFLKTAATAACFAAVSPMRGALTPLALQRYHLFAALVRTEFTAFLDDGSTARLILSEAKVKTIDPVCEEFMLRFRSADGRVLAQGTYKFKHKKIVGSFLIFIVPNAADNGPQSYDAVFNRLIS
jgi:hypothetical protein